MIECSMFTAILCLFSPISVPVGPVPITLSLFAVMLAGFVLGSVKAMLSVCIYILLGAVGMPVFSFFTGGFPVVFGPTGGYVWSYVFVALICGVFSSKTESSLFWVVLGSFLALLICYACGTLQFCLLCRVSVVEALSISVFPFVVFDVLKAVIAVWLGRKIKNRYCKFKI